MSINPPTKHPLSGVDGVLGKSAKAKKKEGLDLVQKPVTQRKQELSNFS